MPDAVIKIDADRVIGQLDPNLFGHFIEHLGRCIYGGIFEPGGRLSDENGFRRDVLEAAERIKVPILRWPGGNFASGYHWQDGVGPVQQRPALPEPIWGNVEPNTFGTDEFLKYCQVLGCEPYICVNTGTADVQEAVAWLDYCNGTKPTKHTKMREANGHPEPYGVKYWGIGNEIYGKWQMGCREAEEYAEQARQFSHFMKRHDPTIKTVAIGMMPGDRSNDAADWNLEVLDRAFDQIDYLSVHAYYGSDDYKTSAAFPKLAEECLEAVWGLCEAIRLKHRSQKRIRLAFDEWNVWYRSGSESGLEEGYRLKDAIFACGMFQVFMRQCRGLAMANLAQLVNVIPALFTSPEGMFETAIYKAFELYAPRYGGTVLNVESLGEDYSVEYRDQEISAVKWVEGAATMDEKSSTLYVYIINRRLEPAAVEIVLDGLAPKEGSLFRLEGDDPLAGNSFEDERVTVAGPEEIDVSARMTLEHPAHSATVLELKL